MHLQGFKLGIGSESISLQSTYRTTPYLRFVMTLLLKRGYSRHTCKNRPHDGSNIHYVTGSCFANHSV